MKGYKFNQYQKMSLLDTDKIVKNCNSFYWHFKMELRVRIKTVTVHLLYQTINAYNLNKTQTIYAVPETSFIVIYLQQCTMH